MSEAHLNKEQARDGRFIIKNDTITSFWHLLERQKYKVNLALYPRDNTIWDILRHSWEINTIANWMPKKPEKIEFLDAKHGPGMFPLITISLRKSDSIIEVSPAVDQAIKNKILEIVESCRIKLNKGALLFTIIMSVFLSIGISASSFSFLKIFSSIMSNFFNISINDDINLSISFLVLVFSLISLLAIIGRTLRPRLILDLGPRSFRHKIFLFIQENLAPTSVISLVSFGMIVSFLEIFRGHSVVLDRFLSYLKWLQRLVG